MGVGGVTVRVLGPVQILIDDRVVELPSSSQRRLLAALALHAPQPVRLDWLCWALGITSGAVRTTVARLRRTAGDDLVHTTVTGYRLGVEVDAVQVRTALEQAGSDPDAFRRVLDRWVGPAFDEFRDEPWAQGESARLDEVHASALEECAEVLIAQRRADEAIAILEPHLRAHPFRDRPLSLLLRALAATGRQTEALRRYQTYRAFLADEVGTEPSGDLKRTEQRVAGGWDGIEADEEPGPRRSPRSDRALPSTLAAVADIVGRRAELAALATAAGELERSAPQVVLIDGEAGIGKTSLVASFVREQASSWRIVYGRCDEFIGEPFQPFRGLVGQLVDALPIEVLSSHTAMCGGDLSRLVPNLQARVPAPHREVADDQATARHLLFQAVVDIVRRSADIEPVLLVVDDLHWAEATGLQLLVHLVRELAGQRVMVIATYRETGADDGGPLRTAIADLARLGALRVSLAGLDEHELSELVHARVAGSVGRDVARVAARLVSDTAGNPLFAEHLLHHWSESEAMAFTAETVTVAQSDDIDPPATIRDLVWRRVHVLGERGKEILSTAAVLGVEFEEPVVAAMTGVDRADVADILDRAVHAGLVAPGADTIRTTRFTHAMVARSLEAELGERKRASLHAAAFEALLATGRGDADPTPDIRPARLAHHAERAGRVIDAQRWATIAGDDAMGHLAADEAVGWFRRALVHAAALDRTDAERVELLVRLGEAEYRAGYPHGLDTLHDAATLAQRCDADSVLLRAALAIDPGWIIRFGKFAPQQLAIAEAAVARVGGRDSATRARVQALLAQSLVHTDQTERRTAAATAALELARDSADPGVIARVAPDVLIALWVPGSAQLRLAVAAEASAVVETLGDPSLSAAVYYAAHTAAVCARDAVAAERCRARLRAIADEIEEPRSRWAAAIVDGFTATMACRFREAEACIASGLDLGLQIGEPDAGRIFAGQSFALGTFEGRHAELFPFVQHVMETQQSVDLAFRIAHAIVSVEVGELDAAKELLRDAMTRGLHTIPHDFIRSTSLLGYAVLALELDDEEAAAALLPEILGLAAEVSFNGITSQGPIAAYVGKLMSLLGRYEEAEDQLLDALATTEAFGWEYHRATTLLALAQNRAGADAFDSVADCWLSAADALCTTHALSVWSRRVLALRERYPTAEMTRS